MERHDHDQKEWLDADLIGSYDALSRSASDHLADSFPLLLIKPCSDNILMYGMEHIEDKYSAVIVTFVLRVIDDMTVYVFINGDKLPDSEFSWALYHSNGNLKYWSQLDNTLSRHFTGVTYLRGGLDPFPTKLLMSHLSSIINIILRIVNICFSSGDFPASCKSAMISPLIKKQGLDSEILKNYRPVANLSFISK